MVPFDAVKKVTAAVNPREVIDLTAALVRINSVWDPEAGTSEQPAAELAAAWAREQGFAVEVDEVVPGRPNVVVDLRGQPGARRLMFEGHTDVVTPGDPGAWRHDPFGAVVEGRRMYGRGTNDTKGNLAAMLVAMAALKRSGVPFSGSVVGGVLCDEEDRMLGVLDFIERGHADDVTAAVICEPQDGLICCTQKGAVRARFLVKGRQCHGAMPLSGLAGGPAVRRILEGLEKLERDDVDRLGRDELLGWPSFTPTVLRAPAAGPGQLNVVPGEAEILVDIRTIPAQDHGRIIADIKALAARTAAETNADYAARDAIMGIERPRNLSVAVDILTDRPCTLTDRADPVVGAAHWATRYLTGREPVYGGVPGATDGTWLWARKNIPIVTMGAGDRLVPHHVDEWVDLDQLVETARIYALTALAYLWPEERA